MRSSFTALLLLGAFIATPARAADVYSHVVVSSGVTAPGNATGAPDGDVASFTGTASWIELGFPETSTGRVSLRISLPSADTASQLDFWLMDGGSINHDATHLFESPETEMTLTINNINEVAFDRIRLFPFEPFVGIDAAWITTIDEPDPESSTAPEESVAEPDPTPTEPDLENPQALPPEVEFPNNPWKPRLIKLPDDGNPDTQFDSAVYAIDPDTEKRRPFFNETIYRSWFGEDFSSVEVVDAQVMASYTVGAPMFMHPGTSLVKIQSLADVYAVEKGGLLRRIPDESTAAYHYGEHWAGLVRDLSPTEWPRYTLGSDLGSILPNDTFVIDGSFILWHLRGGMRRQVPLTDRAYHGIASDAFPLPYTSPEYAARLSAYPTLTIYARTDNLGWYDFR